VVSVKVQGFLATMSEFLGCYSGIVEIVRCADQQYGGIAYGTISVLLIVSTSAIGFLRICSLQSSHSFYALRTNQTR
jgi:hypothetical protein